MPIGVTFCFKKLFKTVGKGVGVGKNLLKILGQN